MSSGSYLTIYRRSLTEKANVEVLNAIKNEYFLANKNGSFDSKMSDEEAKDDLPVLLDANFKAEFDGKEQTKDIYYDQDGNVCTKLLEFHFGSSFSSLKENFHLNPYSCKDSSILISKCEAEKILQAAKYVLSREYSKTIEDILSNEYVNILGDGYSLFDSRFKTRHSPLYIDKNGDGYTVSYDDACYDREIAEEDDGIVCNLKKLCACLEAFLLAEDNPWEKQELILELSAY